MDKIEILNQLWDIYQKESWHKTRLNRTEFDKYTEKLINDSNIIYYEKDGVILGYVEFWRINYEQFGRLICNAPFSAYLENVKDGNICYVANVFILEEHRQSSVVKILKYKFLANNNHCEYFVGEALRKKTQPVKVFNRIEFLERLGRNNG